MHERRLLQALLVVGVAELLIPALAITLLVR